VYFNLIILDKTLVELLKRPIFNCGWMCDYFIVFNNLN